MSSLADLLRDRIRVIDHERAAALALLEILNEQNGTKVEFGFEEEGKPTPSFPKRRRSRFVPGRPISPKGTVVEWLTAQLSGGPLVRKEIYQRAMDPKAGVPAILALPASERKRITYSRISTIIWRGVNVTKHLRVLNDGRIALSNNSRSLAAKGKVKM